VKELPLILPQLPKSLAEKIFKRMEKKALRKLSTFITSEIFFIPFWFFIFNCNLLYIFKKETKLTLVVAIDAVTGKLSSIISGRIEAKEVEPPRQSTFTIKIAKDSLYNYATEYAKRILYRTKGYIALKDMRIDLNKVELFYYPFWIGYFRKNNGTFDLKIINAISGKNETMWLKDLFLNEFVKIVEK